MRRLTIILAFAAMTATALGAQTATVVGQFDWSSRAIVGVSGIEVSPDGASFVAVSDQGWLINGTFARDNGQITDVTLDQLRSLRGIDGLPVAARRIGDWSDAEGLAIGADGQHWIAFERWARVSTYTTAGGAEIATKSHDAFASYKQNRQLEALAIAPDGTILTFGEAAQDGAFAVYRYDGAAWRIDGSIPASARYAVVGADFSQSGQMYLLERKLVLGLWWQSRIRRFADTSLTDGTVIWESAQGAYDNLEGIAVWHDATGTHLTLVSDNNADDGEITQFVELVVSE